MKRIGDAAEYENELFDRETTIPPVLEGVDFTDCHFVGCNLHSARMVRCRFFDCRFERVDASTADLTDCTVRGSTFYDSKLVGVNWTILRSLDSNRWERCRLDSGCFQALKLKKVEWIGCDARDVDFSECNLEKAKFHGSRLDGANFNGADLSQADFTGATGLCFHPQHVQLNKTLIEMDALLSIASALGLKIVGC